MSIAINPDRVTKVMVGNAWYGVVDESFLLDSYEYVDDEMTYLGGGQEALIPATGFTFLTLSGGGGKVVRMSGPMTAIQAVVEGGSGRGGAFT